MVLSEVLSTLLSHDLNALGLQVEDVVVTEVGLQARDRDPTSIHLLLKGIARRELLVRWVLGRLHLHQRLGRDHRRLVALVRKRCWWVLVVLNLLNACLTTLEVLLVLSVVVQVVLTLLVLFDAFFSPAKNAAGFWRSAQNAYIGVCRRDGSWRRHHELRGGLLVEVLHQWHHGRAVLALHTCPLAPDVWREMEWGLLRYLLGLSLICLLMVSRQFVLDEIKLLLIGLLVMVTPIFQVGILVQQDGAPAALDKVLFTGLILVIGA
jgi:hypothetical protein